MLTSLGRFNLIFNKMALIFLKVLIVCTVSSLMSGPNSPSLSPLDYQV